MAIPPFTMIPDARLLPDAPVRSVDALALRDNPLAIAQADEADATPQIYTDGIADGAVTHAKIATGMLCNLSGQYYDQATAAFQWLFNANRTTGGGGEERLVQSIYFYVPAGATTLRTYIYAACSAYGANRFLDVQLGASPEQQIALAAAAGWYTLDFTVAATGSGLIHLTIDTDNNTGAPLNFYVYGIIVYILN